MDNNQGHRLSLYFMGHLAALLIIGIIMVYSSSYIYAKEVMGSSVHFFLRQVLFIIISVSFSFIVSRTKASFWYKYAYHINYLLAFMILLTLADFSGESVNGSSRWLGTSAIRFQPGEFLKMSIMLASVKYFFEYNLVDSKQKIKNLACLFIPLILLILQPDFGTFSICLAIIGFACFLSDFPRKYFYSLSILSLVGVWFILISESYRVKRLLSFMDPWSDPQRSGFQIIQSYLGFANGSLFGQGLGNSHEKLFYLPEAYNDFIFSVIGEELGFIGILFIVGIFISLIYLGFKIAMSSKRKLNQLFISAIVFAIGLQAFLNMGVVLGLLPTKGLNLPFISYGGSSMLANFWGIGLIFSFVNQSNNLVVSEQEGQHRNSSRNYFGQSHLADL